MNLFSKRLNVFDHHRSKGRATNVSFAAAFVVFVCLALAGTEAWREWNSYTEALAEAKREASNLSRSLTKHAENTFELANSYLVGLVERVETDGTSSVALARLNGFLGKRIASTPQVRNLFIYDENGEWIASSLPVMPTNFNNADRDYFQQLKNHPERDFVFGSPVRSRSSGEWIMTLAKPWRHHDGSFGGVVLATISATYFADFYSKFTLGQHFSIALFRDSGELMSRFPVDEKAIGRPSLMLQGITAKADNGSVIYVSQIDQMERIGGFYKSEQFPIVVLVAQSKQEALANWRNQALGRSGSVLALIALIAILGGWIVIQARRQQEVATALAESELMFRMITEGSMDKVSRLDLDGRRLYVSPASIRMVGRTPEELVGESLLDNIHPDDRDRVKNVLEELRAGDKEEATLQFRVVHKNGSVIWVEADVRLAVDEAGEPSGFVSVSRDITERKRLEAQLSKLATTDGLTGVANRRAFDEALNSELRRATRSGAPLSLLLLDVDHFKSFNDTYGHQEGDGCLKEIAKVAHEVVNRAGDLVARYGGEEFAVLLPATTQQAALMIGEKLRRAVEALAIPHIGNSASAGVTVSIGTATVFAAISKYDFVDGKILIEAADAALYKAKELGRNQVVAGTELHNFTFENANARAD